MPAPTKSVSRQVETGAFAPAILNGSRCFRPLRATLWSASPRAFSVVGVCLPAQLLLRALCVGQADWCVFKSLWPCNVLHTASLWHTMPACCSLVMHFRRCYRLVDIVRCRYYSCPASPRVFKRAVAEGLCAGEMASVGESVWAHLRAADNSEVGVLLCCVGHNQCGFSFIMWRCLLPCYSPSGASCVAYGSHIIRRLYSGEASFTLMPMLQHGVYLLCNICSGDNKERDGM